MKKLFTTFLLTLTISLFSIGQTIVSTEPMNKKAILEEFTGIHCGYCPQGHEIAHGIMEEFSGQAFAIAIHQGSYAEPSPGEPDYRTEFGDPLANQAGVQGYPSGTVNRHVFSGSNTALNRGMWRPSCIEIMQEISPVNIGIITNYDETTRNLQVDIELYYTTTPGAYSNKLNVALIQDSIYGPQSGGGAGNNYLHMHMLRHFITGQWGEQINDAFEGSVVNKTFNYTIPESYNDVEAVVENMHVVAFVNEGNQEIYTGDMVPVINGSNQFIGSLKCDTPILNFDDLMIFKNNKEVRDIIFKAKSSLEGTNPFIFELETKDFPNDWQVSFEIDGQTFTDMGSVHLLYNEEKEIKLKVIPGDTPAIPTFTLSMKSENHANAPRQSAKTKVLSQITDLIVNGTGGPKTVEFQDVYYNGLINSGVETCGIINADELVALYNNPIPEGIENKGHIRVIWLNISWTFPALTDEQATVIMALMDSGCNLLIAGQDIGWDIMSGNAQASGTEITKEFYTNYLCAEFVDDGSASNNQLVAFSNDEDFGEVASSSIEDVFGGNSMYPDQINPINGAEPIFMYNGNENKVAAIKKDRPNAGESNIYFGIGLEMIGDESVRNTIIAISHEFLSKGGIDINEISGELLSGNCYPNPANQYTLIPLKENVKGNIVVYNINGVKVIEQPIHAVGIQRLNTSHLTQGTYFYQIVSENKTSELKKLVIVK